MNWVTPILQQEVKSYQSVLDLGCGILLITDKLKCSKFVGVDVYQDYLKQIKYKVSVVRADLADSSTHKVFVDKSFDVVLALDFIEHLTKEQGFVLLAMMERVARRKVIVFTPLGFMDYEPIGWAVGNAAYQTHRSGWEVIDFANRGYKVTVYPDTETQHIFAVKEVKWS